MSYYLLKQLNLHQRYLKEGEKSFPRFRQFHFDFIGTLSDPGWTWSDPGGAHCQMCSGTHWSTLLHSCDGDNTMLPYQEWSKRALLAFYKLLFSKQTDTSETGMWRRTDTVLPLSLHEWHPLSRKVIEFWVTVVTPKNESGLTDLSMSHWLIWIFPGSSLRTLQNFIVMHIAVMTR